MANHKGTRLWNLAILDTHMADKEEEMKRAVADALRATAARVSECFASAHGVSQAPLTSVVSRKAGEEASQSYGVGDENHPLF